MTVKYYTLLLALVGLCRLLEIVISRHNQKLLSAKGISKVPEPKFLGMIFLHGGVLIGAWLEVWLLKRPFIIYLAIPMMLLFVLANGLRWWVIRTLNIHWNVQIMDSTRLGIVTKGPFRWIRHPNYLAVFIELLALPLLYNAWLTATIGAIAHVWILARRLDLEEAVLFADPVYCSTMGPKARFLPKLF